jgi:hypothetical protein
MVEKKIWKISLVQIKTCSTEQKKLADSIWSKLWINCNWLILIISSEVFISLFFSLTDSILLKWYFYFSDLLYFVTKWPMYLREGPWEYHLIYITWEFENFKSVIFWHKMKEHVWKPTNPKFQLNPSMSWGVIEPTLMMSQDGLYKNSTFFMLAIFRQFLLNTTSYLLMWYLKR